MMSSLRLDESSSNEDMKALLTASENASTQSMHLSNPPTPLKDGFSEQTEVKEALLSQSPSLSPTKARRRYGTLVSPTKRWSILSGSPNATPTSPRSPAFIVSPDTRRTSSVRRNNEGSRIPRPVPFHQDSNTLDMRERAGYASTNPDDPKSTPRTRTAIPVRVQKGNTSVRLISPDKRSTFDAGGARLVNVAQSSATSQISGEASIAVTSELDIITEQSSSSTSVDAPDTPTPQQRYGPILRVSSAAEHKLRGSRSVSFAEYSGALEAGNVFYPRIVQGDTPPSDDQDDNLRSDEASTPGSPLKSPQHKVKRSPIRAPPRSSSLSALSDIVALQAATVGGPVLPLDLKENVSFDDLCKRHPEVEGVVRQTNVIKAPAPRVFRVIDGIRSALSLGRAERRPAESFKIQRKEKRSSIPRPVRSPTTPPATPSEVDRALEKLRSEIERPVSRWGRPGLMPSVDQVRVAVNAVGRELVNSETRERRKGWYKEFVNLHALLVQYEIHKDRSEQAVTALCLARAEVNLRRRAMLEEADRLWYRNTGLDSEGVSSKEITAEW